MSLAKNILGNTFIQMLGRVISALLAIISVKLITSVLGVEGYGWYTTVYEFVGLFAIAGDFGLYTIAVREMAKKEESEQFVYSNVLAMRFVLTTIVMLFVGIGGMFIPQYSDSLIPFGIWICTLAVWLNLTNSIVSSILQYHLKMQWATLSLIFGKTLSVAVIAYTVFTFQEADSAFYNFIWAGVFGHAFMLLLTIFFVSRFITIRLSFHFDYWKKIIKQAWPYGLALILSTIYFKIDVTLLSILSDAHSVGFYGVALRMVEVLTVLPLFFMNSVIATMTEAFSQKNTERLQKVFRLSFQFLLTAVLPIFIFLYFFATDLVLLISSSEFLATATSFGSDSVLVLLGIALCLSFFSTLASFTLVALHEQKKVLLINGCGASFNLLTNLYFIPLYGFMGAAATSIASELLILVLSFYLLQKAFAFHFDWKTIIWTFFAGILVFLTFFFGLEFIKGFHALVQILIAGIIGSLIYFGILWKTGVVSPKMLDVKNI